MPVQPKYPKITSKASTLYRLRNSWLDYEKDQQLKLTHLQRRARVTGFVYACTKPLDEKELEALIEVLVEERRRLLALAKENNRVREVQSRTTTLTNINKKRRSTISDTTDHPTSHPNTKKKLRQLAHFILKKLDIEEVEAYVKVIIQEGLDELERETERERERESLQEERSEEELDDD